MCAAPLRQWRVAEGVAELELEEEMAGLSVPLRMRRVFALQEAWPMFPISRARPILPGVPAARGRADGPGTGAMTATITTTMIITAIVPTGAMYPSASALAIRGAITEAMAIPPGAADSGSDHRASGLEPTTRGITPPIRTITVDSTLRS